MITGIIVTLAVLATFVCYCCIRVNDDDRFDKK